MEWGKSAVGQEDSGGFGAVRETLLRTGIAGKLSAATTVTPGVYLRTPGDEFTMPPPDVEGSKPTLERLPLIRVSDRDAEPGDVQILGLLGTGGMATIHLARQVALGRDVAVKRPLSSETSKVEALLREAVLTGALEHPNIVGVHALGRDEDGLPVMVMKRVEGRRWSALLPGPEDPARLTSATLDRAFQILADVCNAVHYAHSKGIVHRDVKPENVLVGEYGEVVLLDWGIAARVGEPGDGRALGTPGYMAPEMVVGASPTPRTDVFLLGATLHRILTGTTRHPGNNIIAVFEAAFHSEPVRYGREIPEELARICNKATARDPEARYGSALELRLAIEDYQRHRTSVMLTQAALVRMEELFRLLDGTEPDTQRIGDVSGAVRFGLKQALGEWAENVVARKGLVDCLVSLARYRLATGGIDEAREILEEIRTVAPEEVAHHADLSREIEVAVRKARALERLGRELDMTVGSGWRVAFLLAFAAVALVSGGLVVASVRLGFVGMTHPVSILVGFGAAAATALGLLLFRRSLLATVANRRVMYSVLVATCAVFLHRVYGWLAGLEVHHVMAEEVFLLALASGIAGVAIDLRIFWLTGILVFAAALAAVLPSAALEIFSTAIVLAGLTLAVLFLRWVRR